MAMFSNNDWDEAARLGVDIRELGQAKEFRGGVEGFKRYKDDKAQTDQLMSSFDNAYTASFEDAQNGFSGGIDPDLIKGIKDQTDEVYGFITDAMGQVTDLAGEDLVDTGMLVGKLEDQFNSTKNTIIDSAMTASNKATFEMDAYMGSAGSDARSAVRRNMANQVTGSILNTAQQNIAQVYSSHVNDVINTTLKGAEINSGLKIAAAQAIGQLGAQAGQLILGTNSAILNTYGQQFNYAIDLMNAHTSRLQVQNNAILQSKEMGLKRELGYLNQETALLTDREYMKTYGSAATGWESQGFRTYELQRTALFGPNAGQNTGTNTYGVVRRQR